MKNERAALSPAQESRLRAPTQRNRRASPHAKAFCGCATPLSPPLRTAVRQRPGPRTPSAADAALRVHKARSPHQTRSGSRYGQAGCLLHQGRPPGGAVRFAFGHRLPPSRCVRWAARGAHTEGCRDRGRPLEAKPCLAKPAKATRWWPQCRFAAEEGVKRRDNTILRRLAIPPYARGQDRLDACRGPLRSDATVREGRSTVRLGTGLPRTV